MNATDPQKLHNLPKNVYLQYIKLFPITQTEQVKSYTTLMLTLIALIVFGLFAISPTINTIIELRRKVADSQFADAALEEKFAAIQSLQRQYGQLGTKVDKIALTLPTTPDVPLLLAKVQTLAESSGLRITKLESLEVNLAKEGAVKNDVSSFVFTVTATGNYEQIITFLKSLQNADRIVSIDSIAISRSTEPEGGGELITTIHGRAYFHPE